jgi:sporulation protein YlmC with PRC-barrel domain
METAKQPKVLTASTLKDDKVTNAKGEDLGKVEDIMLDLETGRVAYVVLSFGRVNWMPNNKLFAVPWGSFSISFHDKKFILNVSKETLESAPGFDRDKWPEAPDFGWLAKEFPVPMNLSGSVSATRPESDLPENNMVSEVTGNAAKLQEILKTVNFPASKQDILAKAKEKGADSNIISMLEKLRELQFQSPADVMDEVNKIK